MSQLAARRPGRTARVILLLIGFVAVAGVGGYVVVERFKPGWFDRESSNPVELEALRGASLATPPPALREFGWNQWRGPNRDGHAPAGAIRTDWDANPPKVVWTVPCGGGYSSVTVARGVVYVFDRDGNRERLRGLDAETGQEWGSWSWEADYAGLGYGAGPRAAPCIRNGRVTVVGATGRVMSFGSVLGGKWEHDLRAEFDAPLPQWGFAGSPLDLGRIVVVQAGGKKGSVVGYDSFTGAMVWAVGSDPNGYSSPVAATCAGVKQVIALTGVSILGIRQDDGRLLWRHDWRTEHHGNIATPVVVGDYVFVSSNYGKGCVLLHLTPGPDGGVSAEQVYFRKGRVMQNHHSTCVHKDGYLYGYDGDTLRCVDLRAGEVVEGWNAREVSGGRNKGSVILAGDHLIGLTQSGTLFLADADPSEFRPRGKVEGVLSGSECWALPALADGRIYLRDGQKVVCLDVRPK